MSIETLQKIVDAGNKLTPMMSQYYDIKKQYSDIFLLFRMGDFYEVFFDDAVALSALLNITLTHRGKIGDYKIPMAGIPHHAASNYVDKLTNMGFKVAICEQIEDPKLAQGVVKRAVTQIVSPGMPFDLEKINSQDANFIVAATKSKNIFYLVALDFTTGKFVGYVLPTKSDFLNKLGILSPKEFILFMGQWDNDPDISYFISQTKILKTNLSEEYFEKKYTKTYIAKLIPSYSFDNIIMANEAILSPIGALAYYIFSTQNIEACSHLTSFTIENYNQFMNITMSTLEGLEIIPKSKLSHKDSLLGHTDKTITAMGKRYLKNIFLSPLVEHDKISHRHQLINYFLQNRSTLETVRNELKNVRDLERILAKITTRKTTASDLLNLKNSIISFIKIQNYVNDIPKSSIDNWSIKDIETLNNLANIIQNTINEEITASLDKGNLIKEGINQERDRLSTLNNNVVEELIKLENKYRKNSNIIKLRVRSNNVFGYFIEIPKSQIKNVPESFTRTQTLTNSERYITKELQEFEKEILSAKENLERLERKIFNDIIQEVITISKEIQNLSNFLSYIDVFTGFSQLAIEEDYTLPIIFQDKKIINIKGGWHPLIKSKIQENFVQHDLYLDENCFFGLITGPNMAGKTTVMREVAIIQLLAQIGSFVPANFAELGICDQLFSRLGASDDITKGQSTFMMEMTETAEIIRHASPKSLIILDEVGRGTSTHDGLSIAWALVEHFIDKTKALTLFSTHYHELINVVEKREGAKNLTVEIVNNNGEIHFLYRLLEQSTAQSFGLYVAKLAGLPKNILNRSKELLSKIEDKISRPTLFDSIPIDPTPDYLKDIEKTLKNINLLNTTPLEAMQKLHDLQDRINNIH